MPDIYNRLKLEQGKFAIRLRYSGPVRGVNNLKRLPSEWKLKRELQRETPSQAKVEKLESKLKHMYGEEQTKLLYRIQELRANPLYFHWAQSGQKAQRASNDRPRSLTWQKADQYRRKLYQGTQDPKVLIKSLQPPAPPSHGAEPQISDICEAGRKSSMSFFQTPSTSSCFYSDENEAELDQLLRVTAV